MPETSLIIDDFSHAHAQNAIGTNWQLFTDRVMGGLSHGSIVREMVSGRSAIHMRGDVSLENNGGFIQISLDLAPDGNSFDASSWLGIEIDVYGKSADYDMRIRTSELTRPWQSYRQNFTVEPHWETVRLFFGQFEPHRTEKPLNIHRLRRLGLVAIGRAFLPDLALGRISFFA